MCLALKSEGGAEADRGYADGDPRELVGDSNDAGMVLEENMQGMRL